VSELASESSTQRPREAPTEPSDLDLIRTSVRGLADKFGYDHWRQGDRDHEYPWVFIKAFTAGGRLGAMIPEGVRRPRAGARRGRGHDGRGRGLGRGHEPHPPADSWMRLQAAELVAMERRAVSTKVLGLPRAC
jgi:hypothetical protein